MDNIHDADLFPILDVDIFPLMPEYEWKQPDALKSIDESTTTLPNTAEEKQTEVYAKGQSGKVPDTASKAKKPPTASSKASAQRVYISDEEPKKTTAGQFRSTSSEQNPQMKGAQLKPEQLYWIVVFLLFVFGAWPIALILFFCKNLVLNKMKTEMKKKGL